MFFFFFSFFIIDSDTLIVIDPLENFCFHNTGYEYTDSFTLAWWSLSLPPRTSKQICATQALVQGSSEQETRTHQS